MTGKGSKEKGKSYERHISDSINSIFNSSARRTPNSGAIQDRFPGDIMDLPKEMEDFILECKKQETTHIWAWIAQSEREGTDNHKIPILIFSRNRSDDYAVIRLVTLLTFIKSWWHMKEILDTSNRSIQQ